MSTLENNTTSLQSILEAVNNLPEAGSGGSSSTALETCTVTIIGTAQKKLTVYQTVDNGTISNLSITSTYTTKTLSVLKNSLITFQPAMSIGITCTLNNAELIQAFDSNSTAIVVAVGSEDEAEISISTASSGGSIE